jgi:hypothetical protein
MNVFEFTFFAGWVCCVSYGSIAVASAIDAPVWAVVPFVTVAAHGLLVGCFKVLKRGDKKAPCETGRNDQEGRDHQD